MARGGILGDVDQGWGVAMATTSSERGLTLRSPGRFQATATPPGRPGPRPGATAGSRDVMADAVVDAWIDAEAYSLYTLGDVTGIVEGRSTGRPVRPTTRSSGPSSTCASTGPRSTCSAPSAELATDPWMKGYEFALSGPDLRRHQRDPAQHRRRACARPARGSTALTCDSP